jgi:hypothetical protein
MARLKPSYAHRLAETSASVCPRRHTACAWSSKYSGTRLLPCEPQEDYQPGSPQLLTSRDYFTKFACHEGAPWKEITKMVSGRQSSREIAPHLNLSLNIGIRRPPDWIFWLNCRHWCRSTDRRSCPRWSWRLGSRLGTGRQLQGCKILCAGHVYHRNHFHVGRHVGLRIPDRADNA